MRTSAATVRIVGMILARRNGSWSVIVVLAGFEQVRGAERAALEQACVPAQVRIESAYMRSASS